MILRKVIFQLGDADGYHPDKTQEQIEHDEEMVRERIGSFHCWVPSLVHDPDLGEKVPTVCALIEDTEGVLHEIAIRHFKFCEPIQYINT